MILNIIKNFFLKFSNLIIKQNIINSFQNLNLVMIYMIKLSNEIF